MPFLRNIFPPALDAPMVALMAAVLAAAYFVSRIVGRRRPGEPAGVERCETGCAASLYDAGTARRERRLKRAAFALAIVFAVAYASLSVHRYHKFLCGSWDLGIFTTLLDNALRGRFFEDYRGPFDHFSPLLAVYLPFYAIWQAPPTLLVGQALAAALAAWPLYLATRETCGRKDVAAAVAIAYLLYPLLGSAVLFDFHAVALSPLVFFWMLYFCVRARWREYFACIVLLLLVKESEAILILGVGLYLLSRRRYSIGAATCAAALVGGYLEIFVALPHITGEAYRHLSRFEGLSARWSIETPASAYYTYQRLMRAGAVLLFVLAPMGFLAARRLRPFLFVMGPALVALLASANHFMNVLFGHYAFTAISAAFGAAALSTEGIGAVDLVARRRIAFVLTASALSNVFFAFPADERWYSPQVDFSFAKSLCPLSAPLPISAARRDFYRILPPESLFITASRLFPPGSTIAAQNDLGSMVPHTCHLEDLSVDVKADFFVLRPGVTVYSTAAWVWEGLRQRLETSPDIRLFLLARRSGSTRREYLFYATDDRWMDFYLNAREALERDPGNKNLQAIVALIDSTIAATAAPPGADKQ